MGKRPNQKRQQGSMKVWLNERNNALWMSTIVHNGRTSKMVRGREAKDMETATELLRQQLNGEQ